MHKNLIPDRMYKNIYKITPERLAKYGKKAVIFDIDNTVAPYEIKVPTVKMKQYFEALKENGIEAAFVSNNNSERTEIFNAELQLFCIPDAGKPSPSGILLCIEHTLCSGIISKDLNGDDYVVVPYQANVENPNSMMEIGYITRKYTVLSEIGNTYIQTMKDYFSNK